MVNFVDRREFGARPIWQIKIATLKGRYQYIFDLGEISAFGLLCSFAKENAFGAFFCFNHYAELAVRAASQHTASSNLDLTLN